MVPLKVYAPILRHMWHSRAGCYRDWGASVAAPSLQRNPLDGAFGDTGFAEAAVDKLTILGFLVVATTLESFGDAIVRMGLNQNDPAPRILLFLVGAVLLFGYGLSLNLAPLEFGRVVGLYIATLFVAWQVVNFVAFRTAPGLPVLAGGALIIAGGCVVTFWER